VYIVGVIGPYFSGGPSPRSPWRSHATAKPGRSGLRPREGGNSRLIDQNIANAQYVMIRIANHFAESRLVGFFCPHSHTARFERLAEASESYYYVLDDAIYYRACDGFVLLPGWQASNGAKRDKANAISRQRHIFELKSYEEEDMQALLEEIAEWARDLNENR